MLLVYCRAVVFDGSNYFVIDLLINDTDVTFCGQNDVFIRFEVRSCTHVIITVMITRSITRWRKYTCTTIAVVVVVVIATE